MKRPIFTLFFIGMTLGISAQKSTFENINDAAKNVLDIFKKKGEKKAESHSVLQSAKTEPKHKIANPDLMAVCKELCVHNYSKSNAKLELKEKKTLKTQTIAIMAKDKSCVFDFPFGVYSLHLYIDSKLVKTSDLKIDEDFKVIEIPN